MTDPAAAGRGGAGGAGIDRRQLLQAGAAGGLTLGMLPAHAPALRRDLGTERIVLVAFAGGVRAKEVLGRPENAPNLLRIANGGVTATRVAVRNVGHYGAALSIFTGHTEVMGIRENERGLNPTLFEMLRRQLDLPAADVWLSTTGGAQTRLFAYSDHPEHGKDYGASVLDGDGLFNVEFAEILRAHGRPRPDGPADRAVLDRLTAALDRRRLAGVPAPDPEQLRRVEGFILDELAGANTRITGPGAGDAKAIRVATNLLRVFQPRVLGITLQGHDVAHGSYNAYVEVVRRNDAELGKLWDAIQEDEALRDTTAIVVLPEFGRDANLNERNGLDHGDGSPELTEVFLIAAGPDFARGRRLDEKVRSIDVCPTLLSMFCDRSPYRGPGRPIRRLFA